MFACGPLVHKTQLIYSHMACNYGDLDPAWPRLLSPLSLSIRTDDDRLSDAYHARSGYVGSFGRAVGRWVYGSIGVNEE